MATSRTATAAAWCCRPGGSSSRSAVANQARISDRGPAFSPGVATGPRQAARLAAAAPDGANGGLEAGVPIAREAEGEKDPAGLADMRSVFSISLGGRISRLASVEEEEEEEYEDEEEEEEEYEEGQGGLDEEDEDDYVDPTAPFYCAEMVSEGLMEGPGVPREVDLFAGLNCQAGFSCSQSELKKDLQTLSQTEGIDKVEVRVTPIKGTAGKKCQVKFIFSSKLYPEMKSFKVTGAEAVPQETVDSVMDVYKSMKKGEAQPQSNMKTIGMMRNMIEKWYQERGYIMCYIKQFDGLETGKVVARVVEGRVNKVKVVFVDEEGNEKKHGNTTPESMVRREVLFVPGMLYNQEDSRRALRDLIGTGMYENVQVLPEQTKKDERKVDVTVMVKERPMKTTEVECDWRVKSKGNVPMLESLIPGGTIVVDHRNLFGKGHALTGTVTTSNIVDPQDLGYRLEYRRPYIYGEADPKRTALTVNAFNSRRLSGVFTAGPIGADVPSVYVHRAGAKVSVQQNYSCNSKGSFGFVAQEITAFDENGSVAARGSRSHSQADGPPTTLGVEGQDQQLMLQWDVVRDTTYPVNGTPIGARDSFQVDQGTGIGGLFNRYMLTLTRFIKLRESKGFKPPVALVLQARHGNTIGDLAAYDAHCLGGPFSVRGCSIGEVATCRRFLEAAVELRVPTPVFNHQLYGFYEYGTDMGSSKDVPGNPTQYFRKPGTTSSRGVGLKVGPVRLERVQDLNMGRTSSFVTIGERF
eukprot:evm.model.scf_890.7 EVM.evm.TU.scf_890.7   scf_890:33943-39477(-)